MDLDRALPAQLRTPDWGKGRLAITVKTPQRARQVVDSLHAAGADFIKVRGGLSRAVYFALAAEARRVNLPLVGHLSDSVTMIEASDSGQRSIEHMNGMSGGACSKSDSAGKQACAALAARFVRNGSWVTPTLTFDYYFFHKEASDRLRYQPNSGVSTAGPTQRFSPTDSNPSSEWNGVFGPMGRVVLLMQRSGMPLLTGSDASGNLVPGFSLHDELALFVAAGLTPLEALQAATLNPAKFFRATDSLGTIASGKLADLVLLDADPLADITNTTKIRAVIANGRYFDRAALDELLAKVEQAAREK